MLVVERQGRRRGDPTATASLLLSVSESLSTPHDPSIDEEYIPTVGCCCSPRLGKKLCTERGQVLLYSHDGAPTFDYVTSRNESATLRYFSTINSLFVRAVVDMMDCLSHRNQAVRQMADIATELGMIS